MSLYEKKINEILLSTNQDLIDLDLVHKEISSSYWALNIPKDVLVKSIKHSLCFGLYLNSKQVGFARVISDYSTFAYLGDVFIISSFRGKGLSKWLMQSIQSHPELQGLRRFCLGTKDAQGLYEKYGFEKIKTPENWMEIKDNNIYKNL